MSQITVLSWHPGKSIEKSAGGFSRTHEIIKRVKFPIQIIDKYPSIFKDSASDLIKIYEYHVPEIAFFDSLHPLLNKIIDRLFTPIMIVRTYFSKKVKSNFLYVPFSELPQLTLAGVVLKFATKTKLTLCNLNVNSILIDRLLNVFLHKFSDRTITISSSLADQLAETGITCDVLNGVGFNPTPYHKAKITHLEFDAVFVGRHTPEKGILDLIKIWDILINKMNLATTLVTAGEIPKYLQKQIDDLIAAYNLGSVITFKGVVSEEEKINLLHNSCLCVFPSRQEGWGIVPMEALACGKPVVAYDLDVYRESIGKTTGFYTVETGNVEAFAEKIANLLKERPPWFTWKPMFTWDTIAQKEWEIICQP